MPVVTIPKLGFSFSRATIELRGGLGRGTLRFPLLSVALRRALSSARRCKDAEESLSPVYSVVLIVCLVHEAMQEHQQQVQIYRLVHDRIRLDFG
jgi:hypothetical protein